MFERCSPKSLAASTAVLDPSRVLCESPPAAGQDLVSPGRPTLGVFAQPLEKIKVLSTAPIQLSSRSSRWSATQISKLQTSVQGLPRSYLTICCCLFLDSFIIAIELPFAFAV